MATSKRLVMTNRQPHVSVCLPVYNGENFVREAIESTLEQSFEDFELVISDNASTDGSPDICREFAARDRRVRYWRSDRNRGMAWNYNRTFKLATGRYVVWIGHDDVMRKDYLRQCVAALDADDGVVLCFANTVYIDQDGREINRVDYHDVSDVAKPSWRFRNVLIDPMCDPVFGVMRADALKKTRLHGRFADSDRVLLAEMALHGRFRVLEQPLFAKRYHPMRNTDRFSDRRERTLIYDPTKIGKLYFTEARVVLGMVSAIQSARLSLKERLRSYNHLRKWVWTHRRRMWKDITATLKDAGHRELAKAIRSSSPAEKVNCEILHA
jgi:glycosyltransferase involved in cell wall biosynthesis